MRIAVIGAGIVGVSTAYELATDGHEVTVLEQLEAVACAASFAHAGVIAPGWIGPWAAPGLSSRLLRQGVGRKAALAARLPWLWRWWRAARERRDPGTRARLHRLARYSQERLHGCSARHGLDYEQRQPVTVLLRGKRELAAAEAALALLRESQLPHALLDAARCRDLEPGLHPATPLLGAITLPGGEVGNCRRFAQLLKAEAERLGVRFRFGTRVLGPDAAAGHGAPSTLQLRCGSAAAGADPPTAAGFDAIAVCTGADDARLLRALGVRVPLLPVHGYSVTAPLRDSGDGQLLGPQGAVLDSRFDVSIARIGQRLRVAGGLDLGGGPGRTDPAAVALLHRVLDDWFPGAVQQGRVQTWKGSRAVRADGTPVIGASAHPGVWLNLGHGAHGWALACGAARLLADLISGRTPALDPAGYALR